MKKAINDKIFDRLLEEELDSVFGGYYDGSDVPSRGDKCPNCGGGPIIFDGYITCPTCHMLWV